VCSWVEGRDRVKRGGKQVAVGREDGRRSRRGRRREEVWRGL